MSACPVAQSYPILHTAFDTFVRESNPNKDMRRLYSGIAINEVLPKEVKRSLGFLLASIALWFMGYNGVTTWSKFFCQKPEKGFRSTRRHSTKMTGSSRRV